MSRAELNQKIAIFPNSERFDELRSQGYRYVPVYTQMVTDIETPVTVFAKCAVGEGRFLLESVEHGEVGRYSFIGWEPLVLLKAYGSEVVIETGQEETIVRNTDPLSQLQQVLDHLKVVPTSELGKFYGGAVGYLGYDYIRLIERLPDKNPAAIGIPDQVWMIPKYLARFDHVTHTITFIVLSDTKDQEAYFVANMDLAGVLKQLEQSVDLPALSHYSAKASQPERINAMTASEYQEKVLRIKEYLLAGDVFQVVLSQRIEEPFEGDPFTFYRLLRTINPSPYLFFLDFDQIKLAGSSPEVMVRLEGEEVTLKPIAGTRPRGGSINRDQELALELLDDPKERAEHVMLVDLGRNDLGKVCRFGSVKVKELMSVERYSHVMHIVSTIGGRLLPEYSGVNLLRAVFPAGTLSGAPKVRAMEIIEELEPVKREFYGGAIGYIGFNGDLDTCITIRTVLFKDRRAFLQVGAGIVVDSIPEIEYQETMNKAAALLTALKRVNQ